MRPDTSLLQPQQSDSLPPQPHQRDGSKIADSNQHGIDQQRMAKPVDEIRKDTMPFCPQKEVKKGLLPSNIGFIIKQYSLYWRTIQAILFHQERTVCPKKHVKHAVCEARSQAVKPTPRFPLRPHGHAVLRQSAGNPSSARQSWSPGIFPSQWGWLPVLPVCLGRGSFLRRAGRRDR